MSDVIAAFIMNGEQSW